MTSAVTSASADRTMAHLSPSASTTLIGIPTQSDDHPNVIPTSYDDVESTQAHFDEVQLTTESQWPFSIGEPSSSLEDEISDISQTFDTVSSSITLDVNSIADVNPTVQSMPPSWISASSEDLRTEYSSGSSNRLSSTPSLPQSISASQTNIIRTSNSGLVSTVIPTSSTSEVLLNPSTSQNVISTDSVPQLAPSVSKTVDKFPSKTGFIPLLPTKAYKTTSSSWLRHDSTPPVVTTSSIVPGIIPRGVTPYSGGNNENKTGMDEARSGFPNATILFIIVPVCVVVLLILSAILIACIRRKKYMKKPTASQSTDLWVNARSEIALVPTTASGIDTPTETISGFKPGDIVCQVVYPFTAQLEGQMNLREKELIKILEKADNGWWRGASQSEEHSGWFPGCYVEEIKPGQVTDIEDGNQSQSKGKSRVSSFMLKKRERIRRRSATAVSPMELNSDSTIPSLSTSTTLPALNSAEINKFNDGRIYKALFAYHGSSKGELSIEEGDIVRGWEKDRNGWMHGRKVINGEEGWFPAVYVDEIPSDTSSISGESTLSGPIMYDQLAPNKNRKSDQEWLGIEHRAIHSYMGKSETDLSFEAGDTIIIYETLDNGWWLGSHGEDVGWLPGSYLEILDSNRDDESSRSDVSSLLSSNDDRNKDLEEEPSHLTSNHSLNSTLSDTKPKPKPVRKAPPPPNLKPLKIPVRDIGQHSEENVKSELHNVILKNQSPVSDPARNNQDKKPGPGLVKTPSSSKPKRPAPPPPPQRAISQQSQLQSQPVSPDLVSVSTTIATSSTSSLSESRLKPGEKPILPKRFAKPKVIRIPRQSSKLQNLAINSRPSSRPAPARPPPPKLDKNVRGNIAGKVQSSSSVSGMYTKRTDSNLGKSPNSVKNVSAEQESNNPQSADVSSKDTAPPVTTRHKVTPVPPITVPSKVITPSPPQNKSEDLHTVQDVKEPVSVVPEDSATVEDSPKIFAAVSPEILSKESAKTDVPDPPSRESVTSHEDEEIQKDPPQPETHLYPLETGPTLSSPIVPPVNPLVVPPEPAPAVPPVTPPKVPRMSPPVDIPSGKSSVSSPVASPKLFRESSPVESLPVNQPVSPVPPRIVPRSSPPVDIPAVKSPIVPPKDKESDSTTVSPLPDRHEVTSASTEVRQKSVEDRNSSRKIPSPITSPKVKPETNNNLTNKPAPPPKPSRVPPPVLPKPKVKPKPTTIPAVIDMPPEGASGRVSYIAKEIDRFSSGMDIPPPPVRSDSVNTGGPEGAHSPEPEEVKVTEENPLTAGKAEDGSACVNTDSPMNSSGVVSNQAVNNDDSPNQETHQEDVPRKHSETDSDNEYLRNGDVTSDSSATYDFSSDESSDKSDTIHLGSDIGESDDLNLKSSENLDSLENVSANQTNNEDSTTDGLHLEQVNADHHQSDDQAGHPNGDTEPYDGHTVDSKAEIHDNTDNSHDKVPVNDQSPEETSGSQSDPMNGQVEPSNGHSEISSDDSERSNGQLVDAKTGGKPVPLPRTATSPKKERSPVPPARPPPPKSPPPKAHRMVNQGDAPNKPKKKTLRRAVKSHVPQGKGELAFEEGSFIKEMSKAIGRPGWCIGMLADGTTGLYPQSHVEDAVSSRQSLA